MVVWLLLVLSTVSVPVIYLTLSCWSASLVLVIGSWIHRSFNRVASSPLFSAVTVSGVADMTLYEPVILLRSFDCASWYSFSLAVFSLVGRRSTSKYPALLKTGVCVIDLSGWR